MILTHLVMFEFWTGASPAGTIVLTDICQTPQIVGQTLKVEIIATC